MRRSACGEADMQYSVIYIAVITPIILGFIWLIVKFFQFVNRGLKGIGRPKIVHHYHHHTKPD